ncbi:hypothetical protein NU09_3403 [Flavobacterium beibuense]|uniref:Uncharacterized protein n=1 Tax=Flavobacterium beibuense TaxID=657326 RepID=A0A444W3E1_9FLAO|nr:hypothetical protein NU09_3403 [Flavobacterium beibuense]
MGNTILIFENVNKNLKFNHPLPHETIKKYSSKIQTYICYLLVI